MRQLSEAVSEKDNVLIVTKVVLDLMQQNAARVHRPLKVIVFDANGIRGSAMSSVNSCKTYIWMLLCFQRLISNHMRGCIECKRKNFQ
jgi:hypothetical protein